MYCFKASTSMEGMEIRIIEQKEYERYEEHLADLYIDTFSTGKSFQYHNRKETKNYLQSIFEIGYGICAFEKNELIGSILLTPLSFDDLIPDDISQNFDLNHSIYVAEMMVERTKQGQGIGKKLLLHFIKTVDRKIFHDAFIRVWIENTAAVGLYKKVGFEECASIVQPKLLADKSGMFDFNKIYLYQNLK